MLCGAGPGKTDRVERGCLGRTSGSVPLVCVNDTNYSHSTRDDADAHGVGGPENGVSSRIHEAGYVDSGNRLASTWMRWLRGASAHQHSETALSVVTHACVAQSGWHASNNVPQDNRAGSSAHEANMNGTGVDGSRPSVAAIDAVGRSGDGDGCVVDGSTGNHSTGRASRQDVEGMEAGGKAPQEEGLRVSAPEYGGHGVGSTSSVHSSADENDGFAADSAWLLPSLEHFLRFSVAVYG